MIRTIEIADAKALRIIAAMRSVYPDLTNGLGNGEAFDKVIFHYCRNLVNQYESRLAKESKETEVTNDFNTMK